MSFSVWWDTTVMLARTRILKAGCALQRKTNLRNWYISSVIRRYCIYAYAQVFYESNQKRGYVL